MRLGLFKGLTVLAVMGLTAGAVSATPVTRKVNNGSRTSNCAGGFSSIQMAIDASNSGDTVLVCTGVYNEQVTIPSTLSSFTLEGQTGATIQPINAAANANDPGPAVAIVYVNGAQNVTVSGLIIDGSLANVNSGCAPDFLGIYYSSASGTIVRNAVRYIEQDATLFGCQTGLAILADNPGNAALSLSITGNSVHDFQKNGITAVDTGLTVTISGNTILGVGPNGLIAQNGIQVGPGATGSVTGNNASGFVYSPCTSTSSCGASSTGILGVDDVGLTISGNVLGQSQGGIYVYSDVKPTPLNTNANISKNQVSDTLVYDGIGVGAGGNTISSNTIVNSAESGIALYYGGNQVQTNIIVEAPAGVLVASTGNSTPTGNKDFDVVQPIQTSLPPGAAGRANRVQPIRLQ